MENFCDLVNLENVEFLDRKQIGEDKKLRLLIGCPDMPNDHGPWLSGRAGGDGHPSFAICSIEKL